MTRVYLADESLTRNVDATNCAVHWNPEIIATQLIATRREKRRGRGFDDGL